MERSRSRLENPVPHNANRLFQGVNILKIALRNAYPTCTRINVFDRLAPMRKLLRGRLRVAPHFVFQRFEFAIRSHERLLHSRGDETRQSLQQRRQRGRERKQDKQAPLYETDQPEWKVAVQERTAGLEVSRALAGKGKFFRVQIGKGANGREIVFPAVDFPGGFEQQVRALDTSVR